MKPVFLSASVPDPKRDPKYVDTANQVAIREAVTALVRLVLPRADLVFGGHPAITPMVRRLAEGLGLLDRVENYQSEYFAGYYPKDNEAFSHLIFTPRRETREQSLDLMRRTMQREGEPAPFSAAFFIGGMEGVEEEFALMRQLHPEVPCYPVGSTSGAAKILLEREDLPLEPRLHQRLAQDVNYVALFRDLLPAESGAPL